MSGGYFIPDESVFGQFLRLAFFRSPNYAAGSAGWTINQDGSAEFNNLTLRGTFFGVDYEISSAGIFVYSAASALGNLIFSVVRANTTDAPGNLALAGATSYTPVGGTFFAANMFQGQFQLYQASAAGGPYSKFGQIQSDASGAFDAQAVNPSTSQTTNLRLVAPTATAVGEAHLNGALGIAEGAAPATLAGFGKLYVDATGHLVYLGPSGTSTILANP